MNISLSNISNVKLNSLSYDNVKFNNELVWTKTKTYIKDGLQLWLDGIENTRNGHSTSTYSWHDLSGNKYDFSLYAGSGPAYSKENCLEFANSVYRCENTTLQSLMTNSEEKTIEVVCSISTENTTAKTIFLGGISSSPNAGMGLWYRPASNGMCVSGSSSCYSTTDVTNPHTYCAVYSKGAKTGADFYQDNVKKNVSGGGTMANQYVTIGGRKYDTNYYQFKGEIYSIRVYDRKLTQEEREHNRKIDKERFGL